MKTRKLFTLSSEVAEYLDKQPPRTQSGLVDRLIKEYSHREARKPYVFGLVSDMLKKESEPIETIIMLARMLTNQICSEDQLPEIMERVEK